MSLERLAQRMTKMAADFDGNVTDVARNAVERASITIVSGTPVDKGVARSNHRATIGTPSTGVFPAYSAGRRLGIRERRNANPTRNQHKATAAQWDPMSGVPLFFTNNVSYLLGLNEGTISRQGSRFIEAAAAAGRKVIKGARYLKARRVRRRSP